MNNPKKIVIVTMLATLCSAAWSVSPDELLLRAAQDGDMGMLKTALDQKANVNCTSAIGMSALMYACYNQWYEGVKVLLRNGASVNAAGIFDSTVLMHAVQSGHTMIVRQLLDNGANVNAKDIVGKTALMYAIRDKHYEITSLLLKRRADCFATDFDGNSIVMYAIKSENSWLLNKFLDMPTPIDWERKNNAGSSPFISLCVRGNLYAVKRILQKVPIDVSASYYKGDPIVIWLIANSCSESVIRYLIDYCRPEEILSMTDAEGHDIKYWAEKEGYEWILAMLDEIKENSSKSVQILN